MARPAAVRFGDVATANGSRRVMEAELVGGQENVAGYRVGIQVEALQTCPSHVQRGRWEQRQQQQASHCCKACPIPVDDLMKKMKTGRYTAGWVDAVED